MVRGRKPLYGKSMNELYSVRITSEQKEILVKNAWIKKEIDEMVRNYLSTFVIDNK